MQSSSSFSTPRINSQQTAAGSGDAASKTVNLFRGDVNLSIPLVSLSGKNGLDLHLKAFYQSNIHQQIQLRNLEAPTGVLGLGWSFSFSTIKVITKNSGDLTSHDYMYTDQGTQNRLIKTSRKYQKGVMGLEMVPDLDDEHLSTGVQESFLNQSLRLSEKATIQVVEKGQCWEITDPIFECLFNIKKEAQNNSHLSIYDGGQAYELESYKFWHIRYYTQFLKWEITKSNGNTFVFGGGVSTDSNGINSSAGNSIQWGVKWDNWIGPSSKVFDTTSGKRLQQQYPLYFNHASTYSPWMDKIRFSYIQTLQQVGNKGLPYTKACYLSKIIDAFGRTVQLNYKNKVFDRSSPSAPREYLDPYKKIPNDDSDAYQTRYENLYLDHIAVSSKDAQLLFTLQFDYPEKELLQSYANIGNLAEPYLQGSTVKRTLLGISKIMPDGSSLPGTLFSYYPKSGENHAGALNKVTYPDGAVVTYNYKKTDLPNFKRSLEINFPIANGTPRVWFGKDYAIVTWNDSNGLISVSIYTWIGYWHRWQPTRTTIQANISPDNLKVIIEDDFCALHYMGTESQGPFYLRMYHKDERTLGQWIEFDQNPVRVNSSEVEVTAGKNFLMYNNYHTNELTLFNWNIYQKIWIKDESSVFNQSNCASTNIQQFRYFIKAQNDSLVVMCYDIRNAPGAKKSQLNLFRKDSNGAWSHTGSYDATKIFLAEPTSEYLDLQIAPAFLFATYTTQDNSDQKHYTIDIIKWEVVDQVTQLSLDYSKDLTIDKSDGAMLLPYLPSISENGLITSGPFMFRYNGSKWLYNDNLNFGLEVNEDDIFWLAHGDDYLVKSHNGTTNYKAEIQVFDPATDSEVWSGKSILIEEGRSASNRFAKYFASAGKDFFTWNTKLYARGTSTDWKNAVANPYFDLIQLDTNLQTTTIINEGPEFLTYLVTSNDGKDVLGTNLLVVRNGSIDQTSQLPTNFFQVVDSKGTFVKNLNGKFPAGQSTFLTFLPLSDTFDNAQSIQLHRFLGNSLNEKIITYPVDFIEIDDGFDKVYHCYTYDPGTAICDPSGKIAKFYKSTHYAGCASPGLQKNGFTKYVYYNGYPKNQTFPQPIKNPTSALDGILLQKASYDCKENLVASSTKELESLFKIKTSPTESELTTIAGAYVNLISKTAMKDGVSHVAYYTHDPYSGNEISSQTDIYNAKGEAETHTEEKLYGYMVYQWASFLHLLNIKVQVNRTITTNGGTPIIVSSEVNTWNSFTAQLPDLTMSIPATHKTYFWLGGSSEATFDFDKWSGAMEPPKVWIKTSEVTARGEFGLVTTRTDPNGRPTSNLVDPMGQLSIASFSGADITREEAYYFGFEPYEASGIWRIDLNTTPIESGCSFTGTRCLTVPGGAKSTPLTLSPQSTDKTYYLGCWMKGSSDVLQHAGWHIQAGQEAPQYILLRQSDDWQYYFMPIPINAASTSVVMTLFNESSNEIYIDHMVFCTQDGQFIANVYETKDHMITTEIGPYNQIQRWIYDDYLHPVAKVGTEEKVRSCNMFFLSRQTKGNQFDAATPNHNITCHPAGTTFYSRFYNNGKWDRIWTPENINNWKNECGVLSYLSEEVGSISLNEVFKTDAIFLYLNVRIGDSNTGSVGIAMESRLKVEFDLTTQSWSFTLTESGQGEKGTYSKVGSSWLLINTPQAFLFLVDGVIVFNKLLDTPITGKLSITASTKVSFYNILGGERPQVGGTFYDGSFKLRQSQAMVDSGVIASQLLYNKIGHKSITTKSVEQKCSSSLPMLTYDPDLVKSMDWISGVMTGSISDACPDDDGYPYSRILHETSPLARTIEKGAPGKVYAITDLNPEKRHTDKFFYGANDGQFSKKLNLPQGEYYKLIHVDANNNTSVQLSDKLGQSIAAGSAIPNSGGQFIASMRHRNYNVNGSTVTSYLPNYFDPPPGSTSGAWTRVSHFDLIGRVVKMVLLNNGTTQKIYNRTGLTRFLINSQLKAKGLVAYVKYDHLERIIERGVFPTSMTVEQLSVKAIEDESWPGEDQKTRPYETMIYGDDRKDVNQMGLLQSAIINSGESALSSIQTDYKYDSFGRVITKVDHSDSYDGQTFNTGYSYDNLGQVIEVTYPSGRQINYDTDQVGRTRTICNKEGKVLANYEYYADGQIKNENLTLENNSFDRDYSYNSPGWLASIVDKLIQQSLHYGDPNSQFPTYNGNISSQTIGIKVPQSPDFPASVSYQYLYDHIDQLKSAMASQSGNRLPAASIGTPNLITYDANGNLLQVETNGSTNEYQYDKDKDFVIKTNEGAFQPNLVGAVKSASTGKITDIVYDDIHQLPLKISTEDNGAIEMAYDDAARRVIKRTGTQKKIYSYGTGDLPLSETIIATGGVKQEIDYIFGPSGMIGFFEGDKHQWILKDHLNSTRAIIDEQGNIVSAYHYLPFGDQWVSSFGSKSNMTYLFTAYEYDMETGLYNAGARLYDPRLRRFYSVDPKLQYASPYLYSGNNPILLTDPDGESAGMDAAIGVSALLITVGIIGAIFSFGASLSLSAAGAGEAAATGVGAAVEGGLEGAAEGGVVAGAGGQAAAAGGTSVVTKLGLAGVNIASSVALGSGMSGAHYTETHTQYNGAAFGSALGAGAAGGLASGLAGAVLTPLADMVVTPLLTSFGKSVALGALRGFAIGGTTSVLGKLTSNAVSGKKADSGLLSAFLGGASVGSTLDFGTTAGLSGAIRKFNLQNDAKALNSIANVPKTLARRGIVGAINLSKSGPPTTAVNKGHFNSKSNKISHAKSNSPILHPANPNSKLSQIPLSGSFMMGSYHQDHSIHPQASILDRLDVGLNGDTLQPGQRRSNLSKQEYCRPARFYTR